MAARHLALATLAALTLQCGAEGTPAPYSEPPSQRCATLDERLPRLRAILERGDLLPLEAVLERLQLERDGARLERALQLVLGILQSFPRDPATTFDFGLLIGLLETTRDPLAVVVRSLAEGPPQVREVFGAASVALTECPRESFLLTLRDLFAATSLLESAGGALSDTSVVDLLAHIPDQPEEGRNGFIALIRAVSNAVRSPAFDFQQVLDILAFLDLDQPPASDLIAALDAYLQGDNLTHLRQSLDCLAGIEYAGRTGVDQVGGLLYDLITLDALDFGALLSLAAPLLEQIQGPGLRTLGGAALDALIANTTLRDLAIELIVFLFREDNLVAVLGSVAVLIETRAMDDLLRLMEGLTLKCPE